MKKLRNIVFILLLAALLSAAFAESPQVSLPDRIARQLHALLADAAEEAAEWGSGAARALDSLIARLELSIPAQGEALTGRLAEELEGAENAADTLVSDALSLFDGILEQADADAAALIPDLRRLTGTLGAQLSAQNEALDRLFRPALPKPTAEPDSIVQSE